MTDLELYPSEAQVRKWEAVDPNKRMLHPIKAVIRQLTDTGSYEQPWLDVTVYYMSDHGPKVTHHRAKKVSRCKLIIKDIFHPPRGVGYGS